MIDRQRTILVYLTMLAGTFLFVSGSGTLWAQADPQQQFVAFQEHLRKAGEEYRKKAFDAASKELQSASALMTQMLPSAKNTAQRNALKPHYEQLSKAVLAVRKSGGKIEPLPAWSDLVKAAAAEKASGKTAEGNDLSFARDIAPVLIQRCGNCHMRRRAGEVSMATFADLRTGKGGVPLITPGSASASRIIEVIEDGSMPKGPQKLTSQEIEKLKKWLDGGAKFDGTSPSDSIMVLDKQPETPEFKPPDKTTISFAKDIAPAIVANCSGCHLQAQQIRGNFNMNSFAQLIRGGMSGEVLKRGKGAESLIVQKLRGQAGQRMPANRPPLDDATIAKFETWINEGASFDGATPDTALPRVSEQAWMKNASPDELKVKRLQIAKENWKRVRADREAFTAANEDFVVLSDSSPATSEKILGIATEVAATLQGSLATKGKSMFPGGATIFVFNKRYDYSEFGKMAESRQLPASWTAHWRREGVNAYVSMVAGSSDDKAIERDLKINLAALWASSFEGMPFWFADGLGAFTYSAKVGKNDSQVMRWEQNGLRAVTGLPNLKPLLQNAINEEDATAIGFFTVRALYQSDRKKYAAFLKNLQNSNDFNKSFMEIYGPVENILSGVLGIKAN